jgi:hypothetical protein
VLPTQDTYYDASAKLLAEASGQMQQEVRNLFPTVANTGVISHHHAPPAASWDAAADAAIAAKESELEARRSRDSLEGGAAGADENPEGGKGGSSRYRGSRSSRLATQKQEEEERVRKAQQLSVVMDDEVESVPDWAEDRAENLHKRRHRRDANQGPQEMQPLLQKQGPEAAEAGSGIGGLFSKYGVDLASLAEKYDVSVSALEEVLHNPKKAAAAAEERLKAAAHEAEDRLKSKCVGNLQHHHTFFQQVPCAYSNNVGNEALKVNVEASSVCCS